ncbi:MAG: endo-1,4-beta-xylanase, partial [Prevotella sp.]|nr:endo-1,4-beta-xylanase [Prevotella sp.]
MRKKSTFLFLLAICLFGGKANAQLSTNPDKFLGNITTRYNVDAGGGVDPYYKLWNQITCENESKWGSVEGTRNSYNWGCDKAFNYAKQHNFTYKFHALLWGAQYPGWLESLSIKDRYASIVKWFDAVKKKYPDLPLIDVVNEAVWSNESSPHQPGNPMIRESLGGKGKTGYDWLIKAFEMAYERWPNAILIYNDYNSIQWQIDQYIDLVTNLRDAGAPIDAYGLQCHELTDISLSTCKSALDKLDNALKMPMYSTEFDIGTSDDQKQLTQYKNLIPLFWERDYCAGVTLWGYIYGATWTTDGNSGIFRDGKARPAMTWLREYMASDAAKNAKSPFPGMKKEASVYVKPRDMKVVRGDILPIMVRASLATKTIEKVDIYLGSQLIATMTEAPYYTEYNVPSNATAGWKTLKAVVTATDGSTYERLSRFNVLSATAKREPYNEIIPELPGKIVVGEYDKGASGVSYYKASRNATTATQTDGWMEYTVDVKEDGLYSIEAEVASNVSGGTFHLAEYGFDNLTYYTDMVEV